MMKILKKINYIQRLVGTAFSYILFGFGGGIFSLLFLPLLNLVMRNSIEKEKLIRRMISFCFRMFIKFMELMGLLEFFIDGKEKLKNEKECILISNHPTLIDVVAIIAYCPNACCIVKSSLWDNIFIKHVLSSAGYIPNSGTELLLKKCKESIQNGDVLIIFPEGTRTQVGKQLHFKRGAAHLIYELKCMVRCVELFCNPRTLSKEDSWYEIPRSKVKFQLYVRDKLCLNEYFDSSLQRPLAVRQLNRCLREQYCSNV